LREINSAAHHPTTLLPHHLTCPFIRTPTNYNHDMKVSAKAEYACVAMLELAANRSDSQPLRVKAIADAHGIPLRFLVQILLQLKGAGLVASIRGAAGGYQLARQPEEISMADVINVIDRAPPPRGDTALHSPSSTVQAVRTVWREIQAEEQRMLEEVSLADLVQQIEHTNAASYQI
jgi:Rrf2 family protein